MYPNQVSSDQRVKNNLFPFSNIIEKTEKCQNGKKNRKTSRKNRLGKLVNKYMQNIIKIYLD